MAMERAAKTVVRTTPSNNTVPVEAISVYDPSITSKEQVVDRGNRGTLTIRIVETGVPIA